MSAMSDSTKTNRAKTDDATAMKPDPATRPGRRRLARLLTVLGAAAAASAGWAIAHLGLGVDLAARPIGTAVDQPDMRIGLAMVIAGSLVIGLAGWTLLAILERTTRRAARMWRIVAAVVLVLSLGSPLSALGWAATATLWCLHLLVGGVLLFGLPRSGGNNRGPTAAGDHGIRS